VGIGDVVEAKKLSRTPTNQRASDLVEHGLDLDVARRESRGNVEESVADVLGLEMSGGPRNECGQRDGPWLTDGHGGRPLEWRFLFKVPHAVLVQRKRLADSSTDHPTTQLRIWQRPDERASEKRLKTDGFAARLVDFARSDQTAVLNDITVATLD
jgi:hypothetical protein